MKKEYALYRGDKFIMIGTIKEIADRLSVKENTVRFMSSPVYKRRRKENSNCLIVIRIEDE